MPLPKDKAWFAAKTYGWGWGLPLRWQGWVVMALFIVTLIVGTPLVQKSPVIYVIYNMAAASVLLAICYLKGEKPKWRWGSNE